MTILQLVLVIIMIGATFMAAATSYEENNEITTPRAIRAGISFLDIALIIYGNIWLFMCIRLINIYLLLSSSKEKLSTTIGTITLFIGAELLLFGFYQFLG